MLTLYLCSLLRPLPLLHWQSLHLISPQWPLTSPIQTCCLEWAGDWCLKVFNSTLDLNQCWNLILVSKSVFFSYTTDEVQYYSKLDTTYNDEVKWIFGQCLAWSWDPQGRLLNCSLYLQDDVSVGFHQQVSCEAVRRSMGGLVVFLFELPCKLNLI